VLQIISVNQTNQSINESVSQCIRLSINQYVHYNVVLKTAQHESTGENTQIVCCLKVENICTTILVSFFLSFFLYFQCTIDSNTTENSQKRRTLVSCNRPMVKQQGPKVHCHLLLLIWPV